MSVFFASSVLAWRDHRVASSAYSGTDQPFTLMRSEFEHPSVEPAPIWR